MGPRICPDPASGRRRMARLARAGMVAAGYLLALPGVASAQLRAPGCPDLIAWATSVNLNDRWSPNGFGPSAHPLPVRFFAPETAALFGKPLLDWSQDDIKAATAAIQACGAEAQQQRRASDRQVLNRAGSALSGLLGRYLAAVEAAQKQIAGANEALAAAPASLAQLGFDSALARLADDRQALSRLGQLAGPLPPAAAQPARALIGALRELPAPVLDAAVRQPAARRVATKRDAVRDAVLKDIAATPAGPQGLVQLDRVGQALRAEAVFTDADRAAFTLALTERRGEIAEEISVALIQQIEAAPAAAPEGFVQIDRLTDDRLLRLLPPPTAAKVRDAAARRRKDVADKLFDTTKAQLAALPATDESLDQIEHRILPAIATWPASAGAEKARFIDAVNGRKAAILEAVNRAEAGPMRGRVYEAAGGFGKLEFVDRSRVVLTAGDQSRAGTYEEQRDGRIFVTIPPEGTLVLTREGARLTGAGAPLKRVK